MRKVEREHIMINREDMMELTRRMTPSRTSFTRVAGCYLDREGEIDGTFNIHFLKLSGSEKKANLEIAKTIPYSKTNQQLKEYRFPQESKKPGSMRQLLEAMKQCGLKNDALMDIFYEQVAAHYQAAHDYAIYVFHDRYDVPVKGNDKERQWESEEVYEYLICAICPLTGDYEPGKPECGFLYPSFVDRSCHEEYVAVFQADPNCPHEELLEKILGGGFFFKESNPGVV